MKRKGTILRERLHHFVGLSLIVFPLVLFWQVGHHPFVNYLDDFYVTANRHVQTGLTWEGTRWAFTTTYGSDWRPLTWLSLMLDNQLYGLNPKGYHLTHLVLHAANTLLLFAVFRRMTGALWRSAFVAALFAIHPLHVESVAWVAERQGPLGAFFWLLTVSAYLRYMERPNLHRYIWMALVFSLGLMASPILKSLPFALLLLDYWPLDRLRASEGGWEKGWKLFREKLPLFALAAASGIMVYWARRKGVSVGPFERLPFSIRLENSIVSYFHYIGQMIWPSRLAVFYPPLENGEPIWKVAGAILLLMGVTVLAIWQGKKRPYLAVGWFWYLGTLPLVNGGGMADRNTYIPLIGLFAILSWGAPECVAGWRDCGRAIALSAGALLSVLTGWTWFQIGYWQNSAALFEHALEVTENNYLAHNNLGFALDDLGRYEEAKAHYLKALEIKPDFAIAHNNLGFAFEREGRLDEAVAHYRDAIQIELSYDMAHNNLAVALAKQGKFNEAIFHFQHVLAGNPEYETVLNNFGFVLAKQGKLQEAVEKYAEAVRINPSFDLAHFNLGVAYFKLGRTVEADKEFHIALRINPKLSEAVKRAEISLP